jgi:hypothetical protein
LLLDDGDLATATNALALDERNLAEIDQVTFAALLARTQLAETVDVPATRLPDLAMLCSRDSQNAEMVVDGPRSALPAGVHGRAGWRGIPG